MKSPLLSVVSKIILTSSIALLSMNTFAWWHKNSAPANYKGEPVNYKAEVPTEPVYPCTNEAELKDGLYLGVGASYDAYKIRQDIDAVDDFGNSVTFNPSYAAKGWDATLFAGYGQYFNWFYIGGEIDAIASSAEVSNTFAVNNFALNENLRARQSYGVSLLPGVKVNDYALIYARVGYLRTSFRAAETASVVGFGSVTESRTDWLNGFNYGVGIETSVYENTSVRGEYTYTSYGSISNSVSSYSPNNNEYTLSLIYHFTC